MTVNGVYWDHEDKDKDDHKDTIVNWNYNNIITNAWIYLNWCERHERNALRAYVDNAIKITTINVN